MVVQIFNLRLYQGNGSPGKHDYKKLNAYTLKGQNGAISLKKVNAIYGDQPVSVAIATDANGNHMDLPQHLAALPCPPHCPDPPDTTTELIDFDVFKAFFEGLP